MPLDYSDRLLETDPSHRFLGKFVRDTEDVLTELLQTISPDSFAKIYPALDLGFPHDAMRLAGGFPTGTAVTWQADVPFVPVDTTINVCTVSIYEVPPALANGVTESTFSEALSRLAGTPFVMNFHRGNHFISFVKSKVSLRTFLVLHSSAAEYKHQFNGLYPVKDNWYFDEVQVYRRGDRFIRYIRDSYAERFIRIANSLPEYNEERHNFVATALTRSAELSVVRHFHHYRMHGAQSALVGCYVAKQEEIVPILTRPGLPIFMFRVSAENPDIYVPEPFSGFLVPHGWGKTSTNEQISMDISYDKGYFKLDDVRYSIDQESSLRSHPGLVLRNFSCDSTDSGYYFDVIGQKMNGEVTDILQQLHSFNKAGYTQWV